MGLRPKPCPSPHAGQHRVNLQIAHLKLPKLTEASVGAVLYTSYLQILGILHPPSSQSLKRVYPPPPIHSTLLSGFFAGTIQSIVAAPLDALSVRFKTSEILNGRYKTMWGYGKSKLREIGPRGVIAGWTLSFVKDSVGFAVFFATFEYVKAQAYYEFVTKYYGDLRGHLYSPILKPRLEATGIIDTIRPHYAIEPIFLTLAGLSASIAQQIIQQPLNLIQSIHYKSLNSLDKQARINQPKAAMLRNYYSAYRKTYQQCLIYARRSGGWRRWLYKGLFYNTIKMVPSTSAGLLIFEMVRRRYGNEAEAVRIRKDGYEILLS